jgi:glucose/mannose transport system substrate-binding protein
MRTTRAWVALCGLMWAGLGVGGCGSDAEDVAGGPATASTARGGEGGEGGQGGQGGQGGATSRGARISGTVEIFSWWTSGGEADALDAILQLFESENPDVDVVNAAVEYADKARETLNTRMGAGSPPDTFQANIGADLLHWVGDSDAENPLVSLDALAEEEGWTTAFPTPLLAAASTHGHLYGLPMNVHRINSLFYNRPLFEEFSLPLPASIEELNELVDRIKSDPDIQATHPSGVAPLALGNQWNWTLSQLTFEHILPAIAGPEYYEAFWAGSRDPSDPEILDTLQEILFLRCGSDPKSVCDGYFNSDVDTIDWADAVAMIGDGRAAMAPMGDWAKGFLEGEGLIANEDFGVIPFPGSAGTFVFTADTFPLPKGAPNEPGAVALLRTFGSVEGQVTFNAIKGSIPARSDIDLADFPESFDAMHEATASDFQNDRVVMAMSGLVSSGTLEHLAPELKDSLQRGTTEIIVNYLAANYSALQ